MPLLRAEINRNFQLLKPVLIHNHSQVLHLPFDKDDGSYARDRSGYNNHGTIYGATRAAGKIGDALSFDGVDDYVEVPHSPTWKPENLTVMLWLYPKGWVNQVTGYNAHYIFSTDYAFGIVSSLTDWIWWITGSTGRTYRSISHANRLNEWHHLMLTYNKATGDMKFYWNGELKDTYNLGAGTSIVWGSGSLKLGFGTDYSPYGFIDEVRIFNRALSQDEIRRVMNMRSL